MAVMTTLLLLLLTLAQHPQMPPGMTHEQHMAEMKKRGNAAMGFDQDRTVHHFLLARDGGSIEVSAKAADDQESRSQIRAHLKEIAGSFASGNFENRQRLARPLRRHDHHKRRQVHRRLHFSFQRQEFIAGRPARSIGGCGDFGQRLMNIADHHRSFADR